MSATWPSKVLAEVCEIKPPKSEAKRKLKDSDPVSFVPMEDLGIDQKFFKPKVERKFSQVAGSYTYFADGDVLLAKITPCFENGKLGIAKELTNGIGFGSSEYIVFRPNDELSNEYLYYFLLQDSFRADGMRTMSGAVGHKRVSKEFVEHCKIPLPPFPEQQRIIALLDEAFAGLATATANAEKNLKNARELFENHLYSVFAKKGAGWIERAIGEVCELQSGTTVEKRLERATGDVPYLKVADMTFDGNEERIFSSSRFLNKKDIRPTNILPVGTTIFPKRGGAILTNKKRLTAVPICADLNIMGVLPSDVILPELTFMYFLSVNMRKLGSGSSIPQINNYDVAPLKICFPERKDAQTKIVREFEEYQTAARALEGIYKQKLDGLTELKQSILQKAFSGDLTSPPSQVLKEAAE